MSVLLLLLPLAPPAPSTPLGPLDDGVLAGATWATLMATMGLAALALLVARPAAARMAPSSLGPVTHRLTLLALLTGALAVPVSLAKLARDSGEDGAYDLGAALASLTDGSPAGALAAAGLTASVVAVVLLLVLLPRLRRGASPGTTRLLLAAITVAGAVALVVTKLPTKTGSSVGRTTFQTVMWAGHLLGAAVWVGGLVGLLALALPGVVAASDRGAFWSQAIRRFSLVAMSSVAAIALSGLWLYWNHVDGPQQLLTTMYGQVLTTKLVIFGSLMLLGAVNQFWLHPRLEALRAAGDDRSLAVLVVRHFPRVVALEVVLALGVLMVAPFLHGSARNQAFQAEAAARGVALDQLPKIAEKQVSGSTWVLGTIETLLVVAVMVGGYVVSGRVARRLAAEAARPARLPAQRDRVSQ